MPGRAGKVGSSRCGWGSKRHGLDEVTTLMLRHIGESLVA